jgi:hypothetical protein
MVETAGKVIVESEAQHADRSKQGSRAYRKTSVIEVLRMEGVDPKIGVFENVIAIVKHIGPGDAGQVNRRRKDKNESEQNQ